MIRNDMMLSLKHQSLTFCQSPLKNFPTWSTPFVSTRPLASLGTLYAKPIDISWVVSRPLGFMAGKAHTACLWGSLLQKVGSYPVSLGDSKWSRRQVTGWGFASCFLKPSCSLEKSKRGVERCLAWACFWVPGIQLFCVGSLSWDVGE